MYKNYWLYQARGTPEPWVVHVLVNNLGGLVSCELDFYAEYLPGDNQETWNCAAEYNAFLAVFEQFSSDHNQDFTLDEIKQVNGLWLKIARDFY